MDELRISTEAVCFIITRARAFHVKAGATGMGEGTNPLDDDYQMALEQHPTDASEEELRRALQALNAEEMTHLLGLMWLGRGDETVDDWPELLAQVEGEAPDDPVGYLAGTPLLGDYLEEGLDKFGLSCTTSGDNLRVHPPGA